MAHYRLILLEEFSERKRRNPAYSLNAFARSIGISAPSLSQILSGKRTLSKPFTRKIMERCLFTDEKRREFMASALGVGFEVGNGKATNHLEELPIENFRVMADWRHYAILSLGELPGCRSNPVWIASQLGISPKAASEVFNRLLSLGLIKKKKKGFYQCVKPFSIPTRSRDIALRQAHSALLGKAQEVLNDEATRCELFSSITMAVDEANLEKARKLITKFRRDVCRLLEEGSKERVYTLAIQLFPLSKRKVSNDENHH